LLEKRGDSAWYDRSSIARSVALAEATMRGFVIFLLMLALFQTSPSLAASDEQVTLSPSVVEKFLGAHDELEALAADLAKKYGDRSEAEGDDPVAALPAYQDVPDAKQRTAMLMVKYGFIDLDDWQRVANSVLVAYQFLDPANVPPDVDQEKAKARGDIDADKSLTPEKKAQALQELDEQYAAVATYVPLPGNVEVVRPYADRIKAIVGSN
jgi:hypothetical protein